MPNSSHAEPVPVIDLFAGPGGLGEGFSAVPNDFFQIAISAEMEKSAHKTLRLRAYYRILKRKGDAALRPYYSFCNGTAEHPYDDKSFVDWQNAGKEALQLTLGDDTDNTLLDNRLKELGLSVDNPWVLIGGPPCQAYSLVGRSRNMGTQSYKPEDDHRHYLYREYLKIIQRYRPAVFVMENVKGILSASIDGKLIFKTILSDLADPDSAIGNNAGGYGYRIHSLSCKAHFDRKMNSNEINSRDFIVRSENYGIPQARHRVILVGVREDLDVAPETFVCDEKYQTVEDAIFMMPRLRSKISKEKDSPELWAKVINKHLKDLRRAAVNNKAMKDVRFELEKFSGSITTNMNSGALRYPKEEKHLESKAPIQKWCNDKNLKVWLNHEARSHMNSDLGRYAYATAFASARSRSPAGHLEFILLDSLRPNHENWETGKFKDRFRVQLKNLPSTTVTSHISKDGHYFIHPDTSQCRSLTVREAARLQTFPDNYFFLGNRTEQYNQVGNAVPPMLALRIGMAVAKILKHKL
jgi:DNA (cytosine-5)-methyltransferase 1